MQTRTASGYPGETLINSIGVAQRSACTGMNLTPAAFSLSPNGSPKYRKSTSTSVLSRNHAICRLVVRVASTSQR